MRSNPRALTPKWAVTAALLGIGAVVVVAACASIMHGTSQEIGISSQPSGARVTIDNQSFGSTPIVADLKRKNEHRVRIELDGYQPYEMHITKSVSGWVVGNILFGGLIGLAVDAITGGLYKLKPEQIEAELARGSAGIETRDGQLYIEVVLTPDPSWERIGTLEPAQGAR